MSGQWASSTRRADLPANWEALRREVIARAGGRCEQVKADGTRCRLPGRDVHHAGDRMDHRTEVLRFLCEHHHKVITQQQAQAARWPVRESKRPRERHPGMRRGQ